MIAALQGIPKESEGRTVSMADWILDTVGIRGFETAPDHIGEFVALAAFGFLCFWLVRVGKQKA